MSGDPMPDLLLDEDDFRLACNVVYAWRNATDGTDPQLIDLIARAVGADRARVDTLDAQAAALQRLAEDLEARLGVATELLRRVVMDYAPDCDPWAPPCSCSAYAARQFLGEEAP